ncbi:MAG: protein phosphatase 2C domain-containing protein [Kineosporiaceae bacterium]|nr:protein phosphatase 2C domain-containing protein [Kineosporiaceae bacterium]
MSTDPTMTADGAPVASCPVCGGEVTPQERFCENCGAEIASGTASAATAPGEPAGGAGPVPGAAPGAAHPPTAVPTPGGTVHDGTLLDDLTAAATDRARHPGSRPDVLQVSDADLSLVPATCAQCQGTVAPDGYCEQCGQAAPRLRDHWRDQPASWLAAVCDRGIRHTRNEDAMAVAAALVPGSLGAIVVCDGVSMAIDSDRASLAAARAGRDALIEGLSARSFATPATSATPVGGVSGPAGQAGPAGSAATPGAASGPLDDDAMPGGRSAQQVARAGEFTARILAAGAAAQARAAEAGAGVPEGKSPPSCTFVAALVERAVHAGPGLLVAGWVGDSRAYWIPDEGVAGQVSVDDSWAAEAIAQGVPRAEAEHMPQSHAITRWLGADAHDPVPRTAVRALDRPGWVLLCSDGLWNYASEAAELAELVHAASAPPGDPAALAEELVAWAIAQGGQDNITVALARFDPEATTDVVPAPPPVHPVVVASPGAASGGPDGTAGDGAGHGAGDGAVPDPSTTLEEPPSAPLWGTPPPAPIQPPAVQPPPAPAVHPPPVQPPAVPPVEPPPVQPAVQPVQPPTVPSQGGSPESDPPPGAAGTPPAAGPS